MNIERNLFLKKQILVKNFMNVNFNEHFKKIVFEKTNFGAEFLYMQVFENNKKIIAQMY